MKTNKFKSNNIYKSLLYIVLTGAVLILFNILLNDFTLRIDATENNIYSLSKATRNILEKTKNKVTLKYFTNAGMSSNVPGELKAYSKRIQDLLKEYDSYGRDKIKVEIINPKPDSEEEDKASAYGLQSVNLLDQHKLYIGLAAVSEEREEIIPFFDPANEPKIEYEITRIISRLQSEKYAKVGIYSGIPVFGSASAYMGQGSPAWYFIEALKKQYEIEEIKDQTIDLKAFNSIILFQPKEMKKEFIEK